jgi:DNA-binding NtrC family response regulator
MTSTILIADDDAIQRRLLEAMVRRFGYHAELAEGGEAALARLCAADLPRIDGLILDLVMPDLDGMGVLLRMKERGLTTPVIVQTSPNSIEAVVSPMRAGAFDFVVKPVGAERLQVSLKNALRFEALEEEVRRSARRGAAAVAFRDISTASENMSRIMRLCDRASKSTIPVLIEGEAGVGKELIARAIHGASDRRVRAFLSVNCAGLSDADVESVLFGHEKGAFAGATERQIGKFAEANGGALFLENVEDLPPSAQIKLLRALHEGEIEPAGAKKAIKIDVRIITASNRNMMECVKTGAFREDLYYRLNVFPISVPPLRARRDDISDLARRFTARFAAEQGKRLRGLTAEALALLSRYDWPGNIRQLENAVFRAVVLAEGDELTIAEFPQIAARVEGFDVRIPPAPALVAQPAPQREIIRIEVRDPNTMRPLDENGNVRKLEEMEAEMIRFALTYYRGQMSEMARRLGIGRSTLYRKMKDIGLQDDEISAIGSSFEAA